MRGCQFGCDGGNGAIRLSLDLVTGDVLC